MVRVNQSASPRGASGPAGVRTSSSHSGPSTSAVESAPSGAGGSRGAGGAEEVVDPRQATTIAVLLSGALDPMALIAGLQSRLRNQSAEATENDASASLETARSEEAERGRLLDDAMKMLDKKTKGMSRWGKKLLGAIMTAVGTAASCITGGASMALVVVAIVVMAAADIVEAMARRGFLDGKNGMVAAAVLKIVGAVLMAVSGNVGEAGSAAAQGAQGTAQAVDAAKTAAEIAKTVKTVHKVVTAVYGALEAGLELANGIFDFKAAKLNIQADGAEDRRDDALERLDDASGDLAMLQQRYARVVGRLMATMQVQGQARSASVMA